MPNKMTVQDCINSSLQLLNQYSIAGTVVPLSYNDQSDDVSRMVNLINDAQMEIASTNRPIDAVFECEVPESDPNDPLTELSFEMPDDFMKVKLISFTPQHGRVQVSRYVGSRYKWRGETTLLLPSRPAGLYTVEYFRYPERLDPYMNQTAREETFLDNTPDTHEIIPYFVAAMVAIDENPKLYYALYNVWEIRLARLGLKTAYTVAAPVDDVYGFGDGGIY